MLRGAALRGVVAVVVTVVLNILILPWAMLWAINRLGLTAEGIPYAMGTLFAVFLLMAIPSAVLSATLNLRTAVKKQESQE